MAEAVVEANAVLRLMTLVLAIVGGVDNMLVGVWLAFGTGRVRRGIVHLVIGLLMALVVLMIAL